MKKRLLSMTLALCMIVSCMAGFTLTTQAASKQDKNSFYDESGNKIMDFAVNFAVDNDKTDNAINVVVKNYSKDDLQNVTIKLAIPTETGAITSIAIDGDPESLNGTETNRYCTTTIADSMENTISFGFTGGADIFNQETPVKASVLYDEEEISEDIIPEAKIGKVVYRTLCSAVKAATDQDTIMLISDVQGQSITVNKTITLDLNDHIVNGNGNGAVIENSGNLTICDNSAERTTKYFAKITTGRWELKNDQTTSNDFNVKGAVITGADRLSATVTNHGGAIVNKGTLNIKDVNIVGNSANTGGAIYNEAWSGNLTLNNVTIAGNYADIGAGIDNRCTATMTDTTIKYNRAGECAGIFANGTTTIGDGTVITDNITVDSYPSAGAYLYNTTEWNATMTLSGKVIIKDNKSDGKDANLCLQSKTITLDSSFDDESKVYVSKLDEKDKAVTGELTSNSIEDNFNCFAADDNKAYKLKRTEAGTLYLVNIGTCGAAGNEENVKWEFDYLTSTLTISGTGAMDDYTTSKTPSYIGFRDLITKVVIEEGVTSVGEYAFYAGNNYKYSNLTDVTFGKDVKKIGKTAFSCTGLTSLNVPNGVEEICRTAFSFCSNLGQITIENASTQINENVFLDTAYYNYSDNWDSNTLYVGTHLVGLKNLAQKGTCTLKPDTTTVFFNDHASAAIDAENIEAYSIDASNTYFKTENGILYSKDGKTLIACPQAKTGALSIPEGTERIIARAFDNCSELTKIVVPKSVTYIADRSFSCTKATDVIILANITAVPEGLFSNSSIKNITLPHTITEIKECAFDETTSLKYIFVTDESFDFDKLTIGQYNDTFTKDKVKPIHGKCGVNTVWDFDYVTGTLTISGTGAMADYDSKTRPTYEPLKDLVKKIVIANDVTSVGDYAFYRYKSNEAVSIGTGVKTIGAMSFADNPITSVDIPANVKTIYAAAFSGTKLNNITIANPTAEIFGAAFSGTVYGTKDSNYNDGCLYIGTHMVSFVSGRLEQGDTTVTLKPETTSIWTERGGALFGNSVKAIEIAETNQYFKTVNGVLYSKDGKTLYSYPAGKDSVDEFIIPSTVETINNYAFSGADIKKIIIPATVKNIKDGAFSNSKLENVVILSDIDTLPKYLFKDCSSLKNIIIPSSLKTISGSAFYQCSALENIYVPEDTFDFNTLTIDSDNSAFAENKFTYIDDEFDGKYLVLSSNGVTVNYTGSDYTYVGLYDEANKNYLPIGGTIQKGNTYIAHYTKNGKKVIVDTIEVKDSSKDKYGYGWTYYNNTKTIIISEDVIVDVVNKPIASLKDDVNLEICAGSIFCSATPAIINNGTGTAVFKAGWFNFNPSAYVGEDSNIVNNGDGTYVVMRKSTGYSNNSSSSNYTPLTTKVTINTGDKDSSVNATIGSKVSTIAKPKQDKKVFAGWYSDAELTTPVLDDDTINAKTILYAAFDWDPKYTLNMTIGKNDATAFGENVTNDVAPVIKNDRTMLPARFVAENLGAKVDWDAETKTVTITSEDKKTVIKLVINSDKALVNGEEVILDSVAFVENDRTYTPVRFVAETLGAEVEWNEEAQEVIIIK